MKTIVVTCVDRSTVPGSVSSAPCSDSQALSIVELNLPDAGAELDLVEASGFYFFGFGVIVFAYLLGFSVQQIRKPIRQGF